MTIIKLQIDFFIYTMCGVIQIRVNKFLVVRYLLELQGGEQPIVKFVFMK